MNKICLKSLLFVKKLVYLWPYTAKYAVNYTSTNRTYPQKDIAFAVKTNLHS